MSSWNQACVLQWEWIPLFKKVLSVPFNQELLTILVPGHNDNSQSLDVLPQILKHIILNMSDALPLR